MLTTPYRSLFKLSIRDAAIGAEARRARGLLVDAAILIATITVLTVLGNCIERWS